MEIKEKEQIVKMALNRLDGLTQAGDDDNKNRPIRNSKTDGVEHAGGPEPH